MPSYRYKMKGRLKKGVSFIEFTISVMILAILAAIAMPVYSNSVLRYRVDLSAQRVAQDINRAQYIAKQSNSSRSIAFNLSDHSYTISGLNSMDRVSQPYRVALSQLPYQTAFKSLTTAAQPATQLTSVSVAFDRFGMPNQGISVLISAGSFQKRVDVAPTSGRVTIQ
jgi:prepilin-type N-terminal cleavage/methylation domain-containing protein